MNNPMRTQLKAVNLTKEYPMGSHTVHALQTINLSIDEGTFVSIVGTSGSGKSTLLHLLGGLDKPTSGDVYLGNIRLTDTTDKELSKIRREHIGFVFQKFCLIQELNVMENILLPVLLSNKTPDYNYVHTLCDLLGLTERTSHLPYELSGGQQQRVAIARALSNDPQIVLCDEPTGNLDKKTRNEVIDLLKQIHKEFRKTILIVTHDPDIAESTERIIHMEDGYLYETP